MLEALVAMAVLAAGILVLVDLKRDMLERQSRYRATQELLVAHGNALALLRRVDPVREPEGERTLGAGARLSWRSVQLSPAKLELAWKGRETQRKVAVYRIDYAIWIDGRLRHRDVVERVGRS
jgi:hypothetical protein